MPLTLGGVTNAIVPSLFKTLREGTAHPQEGDRSHTPLRRADGFSMTFARQAYDAPPAKLKCIKRAINPRLSDK